MSSELTLWLGLLLALLVIKHLVIPLQNSSRIVIVQYYYNIKSTFNVTIQSADWLRRWYLNHSCTGASDYYVDIIVQYENIIGNILNNAYYDKYLIDLVKVINRM